MTKYPEYSVLISVYYKEQPEWFQDAIESILNQTVPPSEIVLVEDGPLTDELYKIVDKYAQNPIFKIVPLEKNVGLGLALREGLKQCKNDLIARMDTDDIAVPNRCEKQLKKFIEDSNLDIVGCWENEFWGNSINDAFSCHKVPEKHDEIVKFMRRRCALLHPTVIFKKTAVLKAGNYQHRPLFEDYDLFVRMLQTGSKCYNLQESLYSLRVNPNLFKRRGGFKYGLTQLKFKYEMYRSGFSSFLDFFISGLGHFCVCIMPNKGRSLFYKTILRVFVSFYFIFAISHIFEESLTNALYSI